MKNHRICIIGNSGSGKSTLATLLGKQLGLPVYHLDRELLHGQFQPYPFEKQQELHAALINQENWVIDGNYRSLQPERLARATTVIFMNISRTKAISRAVKRYLANTHANTTIPQEAKNGFSWPFFRFMAKYSRRKRLSELRNSPEYRGEVIVLGNTTPQAWIQEALPKIR